MRNTLLDIIHSHPEHEKDETHYLCVYRRHQCYGGPEEGGWWYDRDVLESHIAFPSREVAEKWLEKAKALAEDINRSEAPQRHTAMASLPDIETAYHPEGFIPRGWGDGGEVWVAIEKTLGASDNSKEPRPHYE